MAGTVVLSQVFRARKIFADIPENKLREATFFVAGLLLERDGVSSVAVAEALGASPGDTEKNISVVARYMPPSLTEKIDREVNVVIDMVRELFAVRPSQGQGQGQTTQQSADGKPFLVQSKADAEREAKTISLRGGLRMPRFPDAPFAAVYPHVALTLDEPTWLRQIDQLFENTTLPQHQKEKQTRIMTILADWLKKNAGQGPEALEFADLRVFCAAAEMLLELRTLAIFNTQIPIAGSIFWDTLDKMWHSREVDYYSLAIAVREGVTKTPRGTTQKQNSSRI